MPTVILVHTHVKWAASSNLLCTDFDAGIARLSEAAQAAGSLQVTTGSTVAVNKAGSKRSQAEAEGTERKFKP